MKSRKPNSSIFTKKHTKSRVKAYGKQYREYITSCIGVAIAKKAYFYQLNLNITSEQKMMKELKRKISSK